MKRLKTHIIKFITIAISIVYILMPIHKEVKSALHFISHSIENSRFIPSHNHDEVLAHDSKESMVSHHEHKLIDILDYLAEASDHQKESKSSKTLDVEFDKHFHSSKYIEQNFVSIKRPTSNYDCTEKIKDGFYTKAKIPPKNT